MKDTGKHGDSDYTRTPAIGLGQIGDLRSLDSESGQPAEVQRSSICLGSGPPSQSISLNLQGQKHSLGFPNDRLLANAANHSQVAKA